MRDIRSVRSAPASFIPVSRQLSPPIALLKMAFTDIHTADICNILINQTDFAMITAVAFQQ